MCAKNEGVHLGFTEELFPRGTHMCLIYSNEVERRTVIGKYLEVGLTSGEKVAYFADAMTPEEVREWLATKGIPQAGSNRNEQFEILNAAETYCPGGRFLPDVMLETLKSFHDSAEVHQYPSSRVSGEMSWALKGIPGSERLMEYESKVNSLLGKYPVTAICQYDTNRFDGATLFECLKVHPFMIVRGQVVHNPHYLTPDEYAGRTIR